MKKRSVRIKGHATSVSLEDPFWEVLQQIAAQEKKSLNELIAAIDTRNPDANLSSALRVFVLRHLQQSNH
jgi:predicted DNA-binding ribbon-helix-helix protein